MRKEGKRATGSGRVGLTGRAGVLVISLGLAAGMTVGAAPADDVRAATDAWARAYNSHVPAEVVALYAPDAVFWGTTADTLRDAPDEIAGYFAGLANRPNARVSIGEHRIRVLGDIAVASGIYVFTDVVDGNAVTRPSRFSFVYRRDGDAWLIVDHHSSRMPAP